MSETIEDLVIRAKPEGIEETSEEMQGLEEDMQETTESMGDQADQAEGLSQKWRGAMSAMVTGLAVAATGILAKVPILGQAAAGVGAILEALGFQLDQFIRDLGGGALVNALFRVSEAIFSVGGAAGDAIGALTGIGIALAGYAAAVKVGLVSSGALTGALSTLWGVLTTIGSVLLTVAGAILSVKGAIVIAVAAVIAFAAAYITNFRGTRDKTNAFLREMGHAINRFVNGLIGAGAKILRVAGQIVTGIADAIASTVTGAIEWAADLITNFANGISNGISDIASAVTEIVDAISGGILDLIDDAITAGATFVSQLGDGIKNGFDNLSTVATNVVDTAIGPVNDLVDKMYGIGGDFIDEFVAGIRDGISQVANAAGDVASAARKQLPGSPAEEGPLSDLDQTGPGLVETFATGIEANVSRVGQASESVAGEADPRTSSRGISDASSQDLAVFIDGRRAEEGTARYRDSSVLRRGQPK